MILYPVVQYPDAPSLTTGILRGGVQSLPRLFHKSTGSKRISELNETG